MDSADLRDVLAALPGGVVVVAAPFEGSFRGLTATSLTAVSLDPPLVLVSLDSLAVTTDAVRTAERFSISLLERRQEFLAERFAGRAPMVAGDWHEVPHRLSPGGLPYVEGGVAWFECELEQAHEAGDHVIAIGAVVHAERAAGEPLVHWDRAFWRLAH
ncbi:MAG TPA: flavin reductase family protein [Candidatus Dormibacteraeota bacterium]